MAKGDYKDLKSTGKLFNNKGIIATSK